MSLSIDLNTEQEFVAEESIKWAKAANEQRYEISGPAGTGKTTIVREVTRRMGYEKDEVLYMAYVGKAAMVLAMKGNFAKTIHSSIYDLVQVPLLTEDGELIMKNGRVVQKYTFVKKERLDPKIKLIVVDEGGLVDGKVGPDIESFGLPILVLGDLDQLPPVFGKSYFLQKPNAFLTQIMRQAEGNKIIELSIKARNGEPIAQGKYSDECFVIPKSQLNDDILKKSDIIICGRNETRSNINNYIRNTLYKYKEGVPSIGEKIICRQNNWKQSVDENIFLVNGLIGYIEDVYLETFNGKSICIDFRPEFLPPGQCFRKIPIDFDAMFKPLSNDSSKRSYYNKFQPGYAVTTYLAQGSQFNNVLLYEEKIGSRDFQRKALYTGITRAVHGLIIAQDDSFW